MHTVLFTHAACLDHDTGPDHPECPARLKAVLLGGALAAWLVPHGREVARVRAVLRRTQAPPATHREKEEPVPGFGRIVALVRPLLRIARAMPNFDVRGPVLEPLRPQSKRIDYPSIC